MTEQAINQAFLERVKQNAAGVAAAAQMHGKAEEALIEAALTWCGKHGRLPDEWTGKVRVGASMRWKDEGCVVTVTASGEEVVE